MINWRYPATPQNGLVPWYVALWRLLWLPIIAVGSVVAFIGILGAYGLRDAKQFWRCL